jgi:hypothetical protein
MDVQDVLLFLFFSSLEWLALIVLTFAIFKFQLPGYWGRLLLSSFMLSLLSHTILITLDLVAYGPLIQMPILFFYFWQIFRIPIFYAGLMVVNGYLLYSLIQAVILVVYQIIGFTIAPNEPTAFIAQTITAGITFLMAWLLIRTNWGFTFVPDTDRVKMQWNKRNIRLLVMSIVGYVALSIYYISFFWGYTPFIGLVLGTIVYIVLQYLVFEREYYG